jgi:hypothetical protein
MDNSVLVVVVVDDVLVELLLFVATGVWGDARKVLLPKSALR